MPLPAASTWMTSPAVARERKGRELAVQLKDVIDRIAYVQFDEIPDAPEGSEYVWYRDPAAGPVAITRGDDGGWRFAARTISALPALLEMVEGRQVG